MNEGSYLFTWKNGVSHILDILSPFSSRFWNFLMVSSSWKKKWMKGFMFWSVMLPDIDVMCEDVLTKQERRTNSSCVYYCTIVGTQGRTKEAGESLRQWYFSTKQEYHISPLSNQSTGQWRVHCNEESSGRFVLQIDKVRPRQKSDNLYRDFLLVKHDIPVSATICPETVQRHIYSNWWPVVHRRYINKTSSKIQ